MTPARDLLLRALTPPAVVLGIVTGLIFRRKLLLDLSDRRALLYLLRGRTAEALARRENLAWFERDNLEAQLERVNRKIMRTIVVRTTVLVIALALFLWSLPHG